MFNFFFYGTLLDADIRRLVFGRDVPVEEATPATLPGYRRYSVRGEPYPAAVPEPGSTIEGIVLRGLNVLDAARLSNFEGDDYVATFRPIELANDFSGDFSRDNEPPEVWVFIASERVSLTPNAWSVDAWRAHHKGRFLEIAHDWLGNRGADALAVQQELWRARLKTAGKP